MSSAHTRHLLASHQQLAIDSPTHNHDHHSRSAVDNNAITAIHGHAAGIAAANTTTTITTTTAITTTTTTIICNPASNPQANRQPDPQAPAPQPQIQAKTDSTRPVGRHREPDAAQIANDEAGKDSAAAQSDAAAHRARRARTQCRGLYQLPFLLVFPLLLYACVGLRG